MVMRPVGRELASACADLDAAAGALRTADQQGWRSGTAQLYRAALAEAELQVRRARAAAEAAVQPVAAVDAQVPW